MATIREKLLLYIGVEGADKFASDLRKARSDAEGTSKGISSSFSSLLSSGKALAVGISAAFAATIGVIVAMAKQVSAMGNAWEKMSKRTGLSTEKLSALGFAAERSGASVQILEGGLRRLAANAQEAARGAGPAAEAFKRLGINVREAGGNFKQTDTLLYEIADTLGKMEDSTEAAAIAQDLFGKSGTDLLPLLKEGSAGMQDLETRASELGIVFSEKLAKSSADMEDALTDLGEAWKGLKIAIAEDAIPTITALANDVLTPLIVTMREWYQVTRDVKDLHLGLDLVDYVMGRRSNTPGSYTPRAPIEGTPGGRTFTPLGPVPQVTPYGTPRQRAQDLLDQWAAENASAAAAQAKIRSMASLPLAGTATQQGKMGFVWTKMVEGVELAADEMQEVVVKQVIPSWEQVPEAFEDGFGNAMHNIEANMVALGLRGRGIFGAISGIHAGMTGLGMFKTEPGKESTLGVLGAAAGNMGLVATGLSSVLQTLQGWIYGTTLPVEANTWGMTDAESQQALLAGAIQTKREELASYQAQAQGASTGSKWRWAPRQGETLEQAIARAKVELEDLQGRQASGGSTAYSAVAQITETTANQLVAVTETMRSQDATRNVILERMDVKLGNIEAATSLQAGMALLRFQGVA